MQIRIAFAATLIVLSCKKTADLPTMQPGNIIEYKVTNVSQDAILAVIDETDHTITVYLPLYYNLSVIDPEITLTEGATINEIIEPVSVQDTTKTYTVTGRNGATTTYKLYIVIQQPNITIKEVSTATVPFNYLVRGAINNISGFWYTKDLSVIKPYLVSMKNGTEYPVNTSGTVNVLVNTPDSTGVSFYTLSGAQLPIEMDTGLFKLKVRIYNKVAETQYPVHVSYPPPTLGLVFQKTYQQGERWTLLAHTTSIFRNFKSFKVKVNDAYIPMTIESFTATQAIIKVPDDFPPGAYTDFQAEFDGWPIVNSVFNSLTITSK